MAGYHELTGCWHHWSTALAACHTAALQSAYCHLSCSQMPNHKLQQVPQHAQQGNHTSTVTLVLQPSADLPSCGRA